MSTFNLQEMYLTEYNRLIKALQDNFDALKKCTTIEQVVDWLYANAKNNQTISEIDLDSVTFTDEPNDEYSYTQGGKSIKLIKHDNLTAGNIRSGISIEGITGSLVDGSQIIKKTELNSNYEGALGVSNKLGYGIPYYYYDDENNNISFVTGSAQLTNLTDTEKIEGMIYDPVNEKFKFQNTDLNKQIYYKNVSVSVPKSELTTNTDSWTISAGYNPSQYTLERLSAADKNELKGKLQYNQTFLGVTGDNVNIIDTTVLGATPNNTNHIISGQKYYRNGQEVVGILTKTTQNNLVYITEHAHNNSFTPTVSTTEGNFTYLHIPNNSYSHQDWYFDITNLKPENIQQGKTILGVAGTAAILDLYTGDTAITLGAQQPNDLPTKDTRLENDITFTVDNSVINAKNIRKDVSILGVEGTFTSDDGKVDYVSYSTTDEFITLTDGSTLPVRKSGDIKFGKYAFMDGYLCQGTNNSLIIEPYTGSYNIELGQELPASLPTQNKSLANNIIFTKDTDVIKSEAIV